MVSRQAGFHYYCRCGRMLAWLEIGRESSSVVKIVCKKCKLINHLDLRVISGGRHRVAEDGGAAGKKLD